MTDRSLNLKVFIDKKRGLCLTVKHTTVESEEDSDEKETTTAEKTDAWGGGKSLQSAATKILGEFLQEIGESATIEGTPIGKAIKKANGKEARA